MDPKSAEHFRSAFPLANSHVELAGTNWEHANGMTMRDWFAAKAMAAIVGRLVEDDGSMTAHAVDCATEGAYFIADCMLKAKEST